MSCYRAAEYCRTISSTAASPQFAGTTPASSVSSIIFGQSQPIKAQFGTPSPSKGRLKDYKDGGHTPKAPRYSKLPVRSGPTSPNHADNETVVDTVADWPAYRLLYANDQAATVDFYMHGKPLSREALAAKQAYIATIVTTEPGLYIDYSILSDQIRTVRATFTYTTSYEGVDVFFNNLLTLHDRWLHSTMLYFAFEVYAKMVRGLFLYPSDHELLSLIKNISPPALKFHNATKARLTHPTTQLQIKTELHRLRNNYLINKARLESIKLSDLRLKNQLARLNLAIATHTTRQNDQRAARAVSAAERQRTIRRTKTRMLATIQQQFGMLGSEPMDPETADAVLQVHNEHREEYMPKYTEEGWEAQIKEEEEQKRSFKCLRGFELWTDGMGRERGVGVDEEGGVWFGESRAEI